MLKVFNNTARYVDQGGGRRNGSFAIYLEPWHLDIEDFPDMKKIMAMKNSVLVTFFTVFSSDLFMKRVSEDGTGSSVVQMNVAAFQMYMVMILKNYI